YGLQYFSSYETPQVVRSEDGGKTWRELPNAPVPNVVWIDPTSPRTVFIANDEGLRRSDDGGESWAFVDAGLQNRAVVSLGKDAAGVLWAGSSALLNGYLV